MRQICRRLRAYVKLLAVGARYAWKFLAYFAHIAGTTSCACSKLAKRTFSEQPVIQPFKRGSRAGIRLFRLVLCISWSC
jgi:hypothetical protein